MMSGHSSRSQPLRPLRRRIFPLAVGLLTAVGAGGPLSAQVPAQEIRVVDPAAIDQVFAELRVAGSPGCAIGVAHHGEFVFRGGYGYANLDWQLPITSRTVFYAGSVSKQFTAASIALLAEDGLLALDDPVSRHLPELANYPKTLTIRHVIHHTSGVPDMYRVMGANGLSTWDRFTPEEALALLARAPRDFEPGERYAYSNGGYFLLSMIVERASGKSLRQFSDERIFRPLGMGDTHFHDDPVHIVPRRALSYQPVGGSPGTDGESRFVQSYQGNFALPGAGGLYTSVDDFIEWDRNLTENRIGGPGLLDQLLQTGRLSSGEELSYAFAQVRGEHGGLETISHTGSFMGFKAYYVRFPEVRFSIWTFCNLGPLVPESMSLEVADLYLAELYIADRHEEVPDR